MIAALLPASVVVAATTQDDPSVVLTAAEERAVGSHAVDKRRREFATVRACARTAYRDLGLPEAGVPSGDRGEPLWAPGIVGAMTHTDGYRACALARDTDVLTIGIDAEQHAPLPDGVRPEIAFGVERAMLSRLTDADPSTHWDRILFSAKESVYKAWFPLAKRWLGFEDAALTIDPGGRFSARLLVRGPVVHGRELRAFTGRWVVEGGLVGTAIGVTMAEWTRPSTADALVPSPVLVAGAVDQRRSSDG